MITGKVTHGKKEGRALGYPTANLDISEQTIEQQDGVYAAYAHMANKAYEAALVILNNGTRAEVHLLDYSGDELYGVPIQVEPLQKISEIENVTTSKTLIKKIKKDIEMIRTYFKKQ